MSAVLTNASVGRVRAALAGAGLEPEIVELPGAATTAKAAAEFLGCEVAQIANSLVFRAETSDNAVLVMSSGARRVSTGKLASVVGEPIGKANAEFVRRHTGFAIGGVAPVGHVGPRGATPRTFVEKSLSAYADIWAAAGHPSTVFRLSYPDLVRITGGVEAELAE
jgi:prolyl-tRNA editing enzyme YbaK/EbsC (Cys-tRNA(Pro) deacylase)